MLRSTLLAVTALAFIRVASAQTETRPDGRDLFQKNCALCHNPDADNRTPTAEALKRLPNQAVLIALESGPMKAQGASLSLAQRQAIADFISPKTAGSSDAPRENSCDAGAPPLSNLNGWNGWGVDLVNSRMQSTKEGGIRAEDVPKLKVKWAFGFANATSVFGQPTAVGGRLFFGSGRGDVYSLDAKTGCMYWKFPAGVQVRSPITVAPFGNGQFAAYFGDGKAVLYALNAQTGELLWKTKIDDHPLAGITGNPRVYNGRVYVGVRSGVEEMMAANPKYECCTFRGSLAALDASTGKLVWKTFTIPDPPTATKKNSAGTEMHGPSGAAVWSSPTIDVKRKAVYVGTGNNYSEPSTRYSDAVLAFDLDTGSLRWSKQMNPDVWNYSCEQPGKVSCPEAPDRDTDVGTPPILRSLPGGKDLLVVGQKSGFMYGLDPDRRGEIVWKTEIGKGGALGGILWGVAADDEKVYVPLSDIIPGPGGGLFALKIATGEKVWSVPPPDPPCKGKAGCSPAQTAPTTLIPGVVFSGSMDGHLRAYSTKDGALVWDLDTLVNFETVNGVKAHGGSMNATGPTIAGGMMFVDSGYSQLTGMAGNVLLALTVDGK
ncbi:MAG: PQQ-binding-like beta-propeller repeat protein [Bryobacteraceae bacterium]|jgi:polyvinyl alcohol dehydrogenase (cytochrome)